MRFALIGAVAAALMLVASAGCGGSEQDASDRIAAKMNADGLGHDASCRELGPAEVAGERETTYSCEYVFDHVRNQACMAIVDGDVYVVRMGECLSP